MIDLDLDEQLDKICDMIMDNYLADLKKEQEEFYKNRGTTSPLTQRGLGTTIV